MIQDYIDRIMIYFLYAAFFKITLGLRYWWIALLLVILVILEMVMNIKEEAKK